MKTGIADQTTGKKKSAHAGDTPLAARPVGLKGLLAATLMNLLHGAEYRAVSAALRLGPQDGLLEIGCGSGYFLRKYGATTAAIAGLDHSPDMVDLAIRRNRKRVAADECDIRHGDAAALPWENNGFTAVAAIATFLFWPEPLQALQEIHRVLRPGGRVAIGLGWNADDGLDHAAHVKKYAIRLYSGRRMEQLLAEAGFENISIHYFKGFMEPKGMVAAAAKPGVAP